jgi:serine protease Do
MKKTLVIGVAALLSLPVAVFAQQEKPKEKDKKEVQTIVITRTGDKDAKTVIEVDGDKVKINGKDADKAEDVSVRVTNRNRPGGVFVANDFAFNNLFTEDNNRAMLGVVTEGADNGATIVSVNKETAAEKAGLKKGDIITKIGDKKIETTDDVTDAIHAHKPGDKVTITYLRDGKSETATAELGKWKGIQMGAMSMPRIAELDKLRELTVPTPPDTYVFNGNGMGWGRPKLGMSIQDTEDGKGVKVTDVDKDSNAAKAGLKEGDVITKVDDTTIDGVDDLQRATRLLREGSTLKLQVLRNGKAENIDVKFPKKIRTVDL